MPDAWYTFLSMQWRAAFARGGHCAEDASPCGHVWADLHDGLEQWRSRSCGWVKQKRASAVRTSVFR